MQGALVTVGQNVRAGESHGVARVPGVVSAMGMFRQLTFSSTCFYPTDRSHKKRQNLVVGGLLEQDFCKDIYWIDFVLFAIDVMAYLSGELMLQFAQAD